MIPFSTVKGRIGSPRTIFGGTTLPALVSARRRMWFGACVLGFALLPGLARADDGEAVAGADVDGVLSAAPADAFFVAYASDLPRLLDNELITQAVKAEASLQPVLRALGRTFGSDVMIAVRGVPVLFPSWEISFVAETARSTEVWQDVLRNELVPAWNASKLAQIAGQLQMETDDGPLRLALVGNMPFSFELAIDDGLIWCSTSPAGVEAHRNSLIDTGLFVEGADYARITTGLKHRPSSLLYFDARTVSPLLVQKLKEELGEYSRVLQADRFQSIALLTAPTDPPQQTPTPGKDAVRAAHKSAPPAMKKTSTFRLVLGVAEGGAGPWRLLASHPTDVDLARVYPRSTSFLIQGSMRRATDFVEDLVAIFDGIDREIVAEYEQERMEFRREVGFDPQSEFLANLVGAWSFGAELDIETEQIVSPLWAVKLDDPRLFKSHLYSLRSAYQLQMQGTNYRGFTVYTAERRPTPFSFAVVGDVLLVTADPQAITEAIDAVKEGCTLAESERFRAVRMQAPRQISKLVYVDVAGLAQNLLQAHPEDAVPPLVAMAKSKSAVALAVVPYEEAIAFDVVAENETVKQSIATLAHVVGASFQAARAQARRALCMAQMKSVLQGCMIYANDHKNQWPESLEVLAQSGILGDPQAAAKILADPYEEPGNTPTGVYYLYRPAGDFRHSPQEPGTYIVLSEPYVHDGGACFGFADGHVEWIAEPQAEGRLSTMRQGR